MKKPITLDQAQGMLVGMAIGDAVGAQSVMGTPFVPRDYPALSPGQWTQITTQALCLAQMLRSANGWDADDAMRRFVNWRNHGYLSPTRTCFGISQAVASALKAYEASGNPYSGSKTDDSAEALARVAPAVLAYAGRAESVEAITILQCRLTHAAPTLFGAATRLAHAFMTPPDQPLEVPIQKPKVPDETATNVLNAALWAYGEAPDFRGKIQAALSLGGPSPVICALLGQIAGRRLGWEALPADWVKTLHAHDKILVTASDLHAMRPIDV